MNVTESNAKTQPASPAGKLEYAINLARAGRKLEARDTLRQIVALQPVNQAAWLWLSAVATDRAEAEAALTQARKINPAHPSLAHAEQWLANRFSAQPPTKDSPVVVPPPTQSTSSPSRKFKKLFSIVNSFTFGLILVVVVAGLVVLFLGLTLEVNATVQGIQTDNALTEEAGEQSGPDIVNEYAPLLEEAQAKRDWTRVIALLEELQQVEPNSPTIQAQLVHAHFQKGLTLRHKGFVEEASTHFEQVLTLDPQQAQAQQELAMTSNYLAGAQHYQAGQWPEAITALEAVRAEDADYTNVKDLLFSAYFNHGLALRASGELSPAKAAFAAAIALRPDLTEPHLQIAEIEFALAPQTPLGTPTPHIAASDEDSTPASSVVPVEDKIIVIGIAEQRMHVYEGKQQVFDFVVSTGEPGRDTAIGEFEILDKIDVAYASTWNLDMPYWMGIYWSGPLENGIHALPVVKHTGYKLWDGYLGQRVSYGCIILSDADAATLYNWAEVGTKVKIVSSLADNDFSR